MEKTDNTYIKIKEYINLQELKYNLQNIINQQKLILK